MSNGAPPPVPGSASPKKGMSPLAWIAIGCAGLVLVGLLIVGATTFFVAKKVKEVAEEATGSSSFSDFVENMKDNPAKTAAETMIRLNPDLDLISTDDEAGTITFRNEKTGEESTLNFEDIAEGRLSVTTEDGDYSIDASGQGEGGLTFKGPEGETRFGASADLANVPDWVPLYPGGVETQSAFHSTSGEGLMGAVTAKTTDEPQQVLDYYKKQLEDTGYDIGSQSMTTTGQGAAGAIRGEMSSGRSVNILIIGKDGESQVTINYNQKKQ